MAAYAALVSLMNTIDHIQIHPLLCNCIDKKQMESLSVHLSFLLDFVESNHSHGAYHNEAELLESQIARAAHAAEDAIESHVVDQIHSGSISLLDLQTTIHDMDFVKEKVLIVKEEGIFKDDVPEGPTYSLPNPSTSSSNGKSKMVRFDEELVQLSDALTEQQSSLQIIPIVGMGGIGINLPEPRLKSQENDDVIVLKNMQTLKKAVNLNLSEEVCKRIPNVKKLNLVYEGLSKSSCYNNLYNIGMLHKLVLLCIDFGDLSVLENIENSDLLRNLKFPTSLKKLTLIGSGLNWEDLTMIGSLPNLEVLQLGIGSVRGSEWNPIEGEFLCLKYLFINCFELKYWNAESVHFPVLENLVLNGIFQLDKIPSGTGEIPTLDIIQMLKCSESAAVSALRILEEQESLGNDKLRVHIQFKSNYNSIIEDFDEKYQHFMLF
ncbi:hypothetical protein ACP275_04G168300 [Erythranthe tilingii]